MLIKIAKAPYFEGSDKTSYILIDKVEKIDFQVHPFEFSSYFDLQNHLNLSRTIECTSLEVDDVRIAGMNPDTGYKSDTPAALPEPLSKDRVYQINQVAFTRDGKYESYVFDTIAYICNDEGKTLEKCFAGGVLNK